MFFYSALFKPTYEKVDTIKVDTILALSLENDEQVLLVTKTLAQQAGKRDTRPCLFGHWFHLALPSQEGL